MRTKRQRPKISDRQPRVYQITKRYDLLHPYSVNLANRVEQYRKDHRLRQKDLAKKAGVPQTVISNFESGWANPSLVNLLKLSKFFKISIDELISNRSSL